MLHTRCSEPWYLNCIAGVGKTDRLADVASYKIENIVGILIALMDELKVRHRPDVLQKQCYVQA